MIKRYRNEIVLTDPHIYVWDWWCKCGHMDEGGEERVETREERYCQEWEQVQEEEKEAYYYLDCLSCHYKGGRVGESENLCPICGQRLEVTRVDDK